MRKWIHGATLSVAGALAVAVLVLLGGVTPASATTAPISGPQGGYSTVYWNTARTNTYNRNAVSIRITDNGSDYTNAFVFALRPGLSSSGTYARTGAFSEGTGYHVVYSDGGGVPYVTGGTFYLSSSIDGCMGAIGDCFGESRGWGTWSGNIQYNIPVP